MILIWYEAKVAYHVGCEGKALDNVAQATKGKKVRRFLSWYIKIPTIMTSIV